MNKLIMTIKNKLNTLTDKEIIQGNKFKYGELKPSEMYKKHHKYVYKNGTTGGESRPLISAVVKKVTNKKKKKPYRVTYYINEDMDDNDDVFI
ncbi:hypothetical protein DpV83gp028 [Deerpox virus W-848-83]|uniref:Uncharacterized protein n=1 Tax=Deerpox virus (strain Mule deer/United States/W-848-83/1983) TaxID=305674 RepID=Q08FX2_DPV83|nr:hypothetical protein DpV83gp028 [Deerpox virus W-848-83]ABI99185.1 hypothetical protein DpV83gp028 [Deerpox virus W-848-83]